MYPSSEIKRVMGWTFDVLGGGGDFVGKPERNRPSKRYRRPWENNIKMDFKHLEWESME